MVTDLLAAFITRRVLPLQSWPHKMGHMSGRKDPSRISTVDLALAEVARRVNNISNAKLPMDWRWGMRPYDRSNRPPLVSLRLPAREFSRFTCFC